MALLPWYQYSLAGTKALLGVPTLPTHPPTPPPWRKHTGESSHSLQRSREINSFMISLVPP
jgi:hypothetical protein